MWFFYKLKYVEEYWNIISDFFLRKTEERRNKTEELGSTQANH